MSANLTILIIIGVLTACGVYLILERAVSRMLLGMLLFGNAVNLLILTVGGPSGEPPFLGSGAETEEMADPLAQAMVLTAIVITMGLAAFVLTLAYRAYRLTTTEDVPTDQDDAEIAARRDGEEPDQ